MEEREMYLSEFKRQKVTCTSLFGKDVVNAGEEIVSRLKERDLTYDQAYASLQYAYNKMKYESNFLKLN